MTEATVGDGARSVNGNPAAFPQLRGLPLGLYCKVSDVLAHMHWSREQWIAWRNDGLPSDYPEQKTEYVWTDDVIEWLRNRSAKKKGAK